MNSKILKENRQGIAYITLNAPPKNEMNRDFFEQFSQMTLELSKQTGLSGVVIKGAGRHFSSGADVSELLSYFSGSRKSDTRFLVDNVDSFYRLEQLTVPTVAAISGCCLGAGLELALACRFRVASANAVFCLPETSFGIIPGCGGTIRLPRLIGIGPAIDLILSGRTINAQDALRMGIVDKVVDKGDLVSAAGALLQS